MDTVRCETRLDELQLEGDNHTASLMSEEEDGSFLEAVGLGPWYRKASLGFMFGITALSKEMYILNEETYVALCLGGFGTLLYFVTRQDVLAWYNAEKNNMLNAQNEAEDKHIAACETFLNSQGSVEGLEAELKHLLSEKQDLVEMEAKANAIKEKIATNAEFQQRLVSLLNKKTDEQNQLYKQLVSDARAYAAAGVQKPAFQKVALEFAIRAIATPEKAGDNPTAKLFEEYLEKSK